MNDISPEKIVIRKTLDALGVKYYEFFNDDSTHYTTEKVTLWSLKNKSFLTCLIDRKSIVTLKFWIDVLEKTKLAEEIPKSKDYMPKVDKYLELQGVTNINSNLARRFLLDDKIVIFFDKKSMEEVSGLIIKCGGQTILYEKTNDFIEKLRYIAGLDYILVKNEMNIKALLEMQRLGKALKQNKNNVCIAAPNDILINILKVSFENFASIKKVLSGPNKIYTKAKQTNEVIISDDSSEGEIKESCVAAEAVLLEQQEIPTICSIDQTWNNINVTISKSINFHEIRTSRSIRHTNNRLVINPIQNIKHGNGSIKSDHLDSTNVNDRHTSINLRRNKNNFISHFNLSSAKHVIAMSSKNGNERMIINPLALPSIRPNRIDENANKRKSNEDIEYWKKKYKRIEITEMY